MLSTNRPTLSASIVYLVLDQESTFLLVSACTLTVKLISWQLYFSLEAASPAPRLRSLTVPAPDSASLQW